jgi:hypothetical protein
MRKVIDELNDIIQEYATRFEAIPVSEFSAKSDERKWSKKEVVGHLIDSAQNNLRRFIVAQYEPEPTKIVYDQDFWVKANAYQAMRKEDVIDLWCLLNNRIVTVLQNMAEENYSKQSLTSQLMTVRFLAEDYVRHLKHHINQVIPASFDIVYKS